MESAHDSSNYSDPGNAMSASEETEAEELRERQIECFFNNFNFMSRKQQESIADEVLQMDNEHMDTLRDIKPVEAVIKSIVHNIGIDGSLIPFFRGKNNYLEINKAAREYAEGCIDNNNIFWECE